MTRGIIINGGGRFLNHLTERNVEWPKWVVCVHVTVCMSVCVFKGLRGYHISSYYSRLLIHSTAVIIETLLVEMLRANITMNEWNGQRRRPVLIYSQKNIFAFVPRTIFIYTHIYVYVCVRLCIMYIYKSGV